MHAASRHGTPSLTSLPKDDEVSCEVRPLRSPTHQNISIQLSQIINESFQSIGIFPDNLKIAKVIPIFKKGDASKNSNYRPISLLSVFIKIFEKIMHERFYNFLEFHEILF